MRKRTLTLYGRGLFSLESLVPYFLALLVGTTLILSCGVPLDCLVFGIQALSAIMQLYLYRVCTCLNRADHQPTSLLSTIWLWLRRRIFPQSQTSSSECSLLEEQMQARHPS